MDFITSCLTHSSLKIVVGDKGIKLNLHLLNKQRMKKIT